MSLRLRTVSLFGRVRNTRRCASKTFVSEHYKPDADEVKNVIAALETDTRIANDGSLTVRVCRLCPKGNKDDIGNLWKLTIRPNGSYFCYRCSQGGNWLELKKKTLGTGNHVQLLYAKDTFDPALNKKGSNSAALLSKKQLVPVDVPKTLGLFNHKSDSPNFQNATNVLQFLNTVRGINNVTLMRYGVGMAVEKFMSDSGSWEDQLCVTFPWMKAKTTDASEDVPMEIIRIKYRALKTKGLQRILPKGGEWGFFGWHTVRASHKEIVITEGEYDAMAVAQGLAVKATVKLKSKVRRKSKTAEESNSTAAVEAEAEGAEDLFSDLPAISLPNGCNSLPVELIPLLERFDRIYLWLDNDKSGQDSAAKFAKKLGLKRCYIVRPNGLMEDPPKDANDALRQDPQLIRGMISEAEVLSHERIQRFADYRSLVLSAIRKKDVTDGGTPTPSMPKLVKICKGFRGGELVVFTGPTGAGKTTLLSQLSLDFAKAGVPTLWASFEILNSKLMEKMLRQSYRKGDVSLLDSKALDAVADEFSTLPLLFLNFYGSSDLDQIVEAMDYAVYRDDVKHIILDNLQFMLPRSVSAGNYDKFNMQDVVIERFRRFATEKMVNVILVVHPRKEDESVSLNLASVFGSAKATQEADLVLILQGRRGVYTSLDVKKNRFDGCLGHVFLQYSPPLHCFIEADEDAAKKEMLEAEPSGKLVRKKV